MQGIHIPNSGFKTLESMDQYSEFRRQHLSVRDQDRGFRNQDPAFSNQNPAFSYQDPGTEGSVFQIHTDKRI